MICGASYIINAANTPPYYAFDYYAEYDPNFSLQRAVVHTDSTDSSKMVATDIIEVPNLGFISATDKFTGLKDYTPSETGLKFLDFSFNNLNYTIMDVNMMDKELELEIDSIVSIFGNYFNSSGPNKKPSGIFSYFDINGRFWPSTLYPNLNIYNIPDDITYYNFKKYVDHFGNQRYNLFCNKYNAGLENPYFINIDAILQNNCLVTDPVDYNQGPDYYTNWRGDNPFTIQELNTDQIIEIDIESQVTCVTE